MLHLFRDLAEIPHDPEPGEQPDRVVQVEEVAGAGAQADTAAANVGSFDANGVAGVVDFQYQYAKIGIVPFTVQGGMLESFSDASSSGNASGY